MTVKRLPQVQGVQKNSFLLKNSYLYKQTKAYLAAFTLLISATPISFSSFTLLSAEDSLWNAANLTGANEEQTNLDTNLDTDLDPYANLYPDFEPAQVPEETEAPASYLDDEQRIVETIDVTFADREETTTLLKQKVLTRLKTLAGRYFSQSDFDQDLKMLVREYDHVEPTLRREGKRIHLSLRIWPKPLIRSITWVGNQKFPTKTLQNQLDIAVKSRFERGSFHKAFQKLKAFYIKKGFFESELDYAVTFHEECNDISITITVNEGRSGKIENIFFSGFTPTEKKELSLNMITKRYRAFISWVTGDGIYDQDAVKMDEFRILEFLHNEGYADAKVDVEVRESSFENRIEVDISSERGTQYRIGTIVTEGDDCILSKEEIARAMTVHTNGVYSPDALRETISRLQNAYGRQGYIDALVDLDTKLNSEACTYDLKFTISPGQRYRIGLVRVVGNLCTQTRVILHENLMIPGELFNMDMLRITEMRLFNIGYFKNVNIYPVESEELSEDGCPVRDVVIEVEETGTGNFQAFGGYSTTESLFCGITITESNFDHVGLSCAHKKGLCALRGGGEFLSLTTNVGLKSNSVQLSWTQPHFKDTPWSIGFDVDRSSSRLISDDYTIVSVGGSVHASYPLTPFLRYSNHYRLQNSDVIPTKKGRRERRKIQRSNEDFARRDPEGYAAALKKQQEKELNCDICNEWFGFGRKDGLISAIGCGLGYDNTDSPVCPTKGARTRLDIEYAGLGGDFHFYSVAWNNTYYQPISERGTLKLRADMNFIKPIGSTKACDIPLDERFFLGGDTGVRGYRPYAIGPKVDGEPVGGISMQLLSAEYNYRFSLFDGFLFYDAGALSPEEWHFGRLRTAAGFGVRFQVLQQAPPVTMGIGFPINPRGRSEVKRFFWSMGGRF